MNEVPRLSTKEALILKLLINEAREMYGLEMIEKSGGELKRGTVYVFLSRMEDKGYVTSRREEVSVGARGTPRRLYKPQGLGERAYAARQAAAQQFAEGLT